MLLPNAKIVGIESLSFGSADHDMSHLQNTRKAPRAMPRDDAADRDWQAEAMFKPPAPAESQGKAAPRLPFAARRALNVVRMNSRGER